MKVPGPEWVRERIGEAVRDARLEQDTSQDDLAAAIGVRQPTISDLEKGKAEPPVYRLIEIERALGLPLGHVLIRAGFVEGLDSVEQAIAADRDLNKGARQAILAVYRGLRGEHE